MKAVRGINEVTGKDAYRFWSKVQLNLSGCWEWQAAKTNTGYGLFYLDGRLILAHRIAFFLEVHDPGTRHVLHHCDNPGCVRPDHLFDGTHLDNMQDMGGKGRSGKGPPPRTHCPKGHELTPHNTTIVNRSNGKTERWCRTCHNARARRGYHNRKQRAQ